MAVDRAQNLNDTHGLRLKKREKRQYLDKSLMEVLQAVCRMDDRPKTDWFVFNIPVQVGNTFK